MYNLRDGLCEIHDCALKMLSAADDVNDFWKLVKVSVSIDGVVWEAFIEAK